MSNKLASKQTPNKPQSVVVTTQQTVIHGPLPPAEEVARYEATMAGAAKIIFDLAIKEQEFYHSIQQQAQNVVAQSQRDESKAERRGQWMAFILLLVVMGVSVFLALAGYEKLACCFIGATVVGVIGKFIKGDKK